MAEAGISAPAEQTLYISDKWLDEHGNNPNSAIDIIERTPAAAFETTINIPTTGGRGRFEPRGVSINACLSEGKADDTLTFAYIKRCLKNDPKPVRLKYTTGTIHSDRPIKIYAEGTTARGIAIRA